MMGKITVDTGFGQYRQQIYNAALRDKELSIGGMGLYAQIASLPKKFKITEAGLTAMVGTKLSGVQSKLKELEVNGYLTRTKRAKSKTTGKWQSDIYTAHTDPKDIIKKLADKSDFEQIGELGEEESNLFFDCSRMYENNYTLICHSIFIDMTLSLNAKGLYILMMSLPPWFNFTPERAAGVLTKTKKDGIRSALEELKSAGYITQHRFKTDIEYRLHHDPRHLLNSDLDSDTKVRIYGRGIRLSRQEYEDLKSKFGVTKLKKYFKQAKTMKDTLTKKQLSALGIDIFHSDKELVEYWAGLDA